MAPVALGGVSRIHRHGNGQFAAVPVFTLLEDETVQSLKGYRMDYTPPVMLLKTLLYSTLSCLVLIHTFLLQAGTPRTMTTAEARRKLLAPGEGNVPSWP